MRNLKYIPTARLKEILNEPYCRGVNGKDYWVVKEELEQILWERQSREEIDTDKFFPLDEDNKAC